MMGQADGRSFRAALPGAAKADAEWKVYLERMAAEAGVSVEEYRAMLARSAKERAGRADEDSYDWGDSL